ncbi:hypothetical protein ES702_07217 [subsurface metagenome]
MSLQTTAGVAGKIHDKLEPMPYNIPIKKAPIFEEDVLKIDEDEIPIDSYYSWGKTTYDEWQPTKFISSLHSSRLKLQKAITVSLEYDSYQFIAYAPDLDIYGWGDTEYEAIEDLRQSIVELYFDLKGEKLAPSLRKIWDYLNSIVEEIESPRSQESI